MTSSEQIRLCVCLNLHMRTDLLLLLPVLKELLHRGGMSDGQYSILLKELEKL